MSGTGADHVVTSVTLYGWSAAGRAWSRVLTEIFLVCDLLLCKLTVRRFTDLEVTMP